MQDYAKTIISQYSESPTLTALISTINDWIDPAANIEQFYTLIWDIATAQGYGLDVWGRIVGVVRNINVPITKYFGFAEASNLSSDPFGQSAFYVDGESLTNQYQLIDDNFRTLVYAKAASNITDCSIPSINQILLTLFPDNKAYVTDNASFEYAHFGFEEPHDALTFQDIDSVFGDSFATTFKRMQISYVFKFQPTFDETAIITQTGVLPRPVGTHVNQTIYQPVPENLTFNVSATLGVTLDLQLLQFQNPVAYAQFDTNDFINSTTLPPLAPSATLSSTFDFQDSVTKNDVYQSILTAQVDTSSILTIEPYWPILLSDTDLNTDSAVTFNQQDYLDVTLGYSCSFINQHGFISEIENDLIFSTTATRILPRVSIHTATLGYSTSVQVIQPGVITQVIGFNVVNYQVGTDVAATLGTTAGFSATASVTLPSGNITQVTDFTIKNYSTT